MWKAVFWYGVAAVWGTTILCYPISSAAATENPSLQGEAGIEEVARTPWAPFTLPEAAQAEKDAVIAELWGRIETYWHVGVPGRGAEDYPLGRLINQVDGPKYGEIRGLLEAITVLDPQDFEAWSDAAWLLWHWSNDEATSVYENAAKALKDPEDLSRLYCEWAAFCLHQTSDVPGAADKLSRADSLGPAWKPTKHLFAEVLVELGRYSEAREVWKKCLELWPDDTRAADNLALTDQQLAERTEQKRKSREERGKAATQDLGYRPTA